MFTESTYKQIRISVHWNQKSFSLKGVLLPFVEIR